MAPTNPALEAQVASLRELLADNPDLVPALGLEARPDPGPSVPLTIGHVFHDLVALLPGHGDPDRAVQLHSAVDEFIAHVDPGSVPEENDPATTEAPAPPADTRGGIPADPDPADVGSGPDFEAPGA